MQTACKALKYIRWTVRSAAAAVIVLSAPQLSAQALGFPGQGNMPTSFADLIENVAPGVVNIIAIENGTAAQGGSEGQGSGFVITRDGRVVTNYHVIRGADELRVEFGNGESFAASVIGEDEETDLALLKIANDRSFKYVEFHTGNPIRVGDWVLAIGNPFGIGQSSSVGIISALGRDAEGSGPYIDYLQTDAVINRGNSGGPLFNMAGKVVAVNSAIYSPTGASVGIGYSIPHFMAEGIVNELMAYGRVRRGFFGASMRTAEMTWENQGNFHGGATIESLVQGGPAQIAGIQVEDVIMNINGHSIMNSAEATRTIAGLRAGTVVPFEVQRMNQKELITVNVTLSERPGKEQIDALLGTAPSGVDQGPTAAAPSTGGMGLVDLSSNFRDSIGMRRDQVGVYIDTVSPNSQAARKGLKSGMVILEMDNKPLASVAIFESQLAKALRAKKSSVLLKVRTLNGSENYVGLPIGG